MAGDLHGDGLDTALAHDGEQGLEVGGFGSGALGLDALLADAHLDGADEPGGSDGLQAALDEVGGGGLAGGAGDADLQQTAAGVAVDRGRQFAHPSARVVDHQDRQPGRGGALGAGGVGQDGDRAEARGLRDEVGAVQAGAREGGVQVAGADRARVVGDARDLGGALRLLGTQLIGELREGCGGDLGRPGRSRICHGSALLGGLGLISVWHGGERTGRTALRAKRGRGGRRGRCLVPGVGSDHGHGLVPGLFGAEQWRAGVGGGRGTKKGSGGQGVKETGRFAAFAPVGGTWRVFRANSMTCLKTGPQIWPPK